MSDDIEETTIYIRQIVDDTKISVAVDANQQDHTAENVSAIDKYASSLSSGMKLTESNLAVHFEIYAGRTVEDTEVALKAHQDCTTEVLSTTKKQTESENSEVKSTETNLASNIEISKTDIITNVEGTEMALTECILDSSSEIRLTIETGTFKILSAIDSLRRVYAVTKNVPIQGEVDTKCTGKGAIEDKSEETKDTGARLGDLNIDDNEDGQYDLGSDTIEDILISQEETNEYLKVLDQCGYAELMRKLEETNSSWKNVKIKLAITGESGSGKSSLINALRGLKDDDEDAAKTGCVETTKEPTPYPHPYNKNLELWDLPGVGTRNFKKKDYLTKVNFKEYDFIILVSSVRFTCFDTWLAKKIQDIFNDTNLFFIRTKVDNDLRNIDQGNRRPMDESDRQKTLLSIRKSCEDNLMQDGIVNPRIFLVNNHSTQTHEFDKFANTLLHKVNALKRDALVLSLTSLTEEIVAAKVETLNRRLNDVSRRAAIAAVLSHRQLGERKEDKILKDEILFYKQQLGIDSTSLEIVAERFNCDIEEVYDALHSETHAIMRTFNEYCANQDKVVPSYWHDLPIFGKWIKSRDYHRQYYVMLKRLLEKCVNENKTLQRNIAIWSNP